MSLSYLIQAVRDERVVARGTAWFLNAQTVVTAFHVVGDEPSDEWLSTKLPALEYRLVAGAEPIRLTPLAADEIADVAMLTPARAPAEVQRVPLAETAVSPFGAAWHSAGFPAFHDGVFRLHGTLTRGDDTRLARALQLTVVQGTRLDWSGISGAPVWSMMARVTLVRSQEPIQALALGPDGAVWTGERLGGLHVRRVNGSDLPLTVAQGFPSMHVRALAPVDRAGAKVWAGTAAGAARVALATDTLQIERTVDYRDGLPTGMVAALTAREDGAVFLAYNALDARWFVEPDLAQRRAASGVYFVPAAGAPLPPMLLYRDNEQVANADIRAMALSG